MADKTEVYDVTPLVGNQGTEGVAVDTLIRLVVRTVRPAAWFKAGGLATARGFYNPNAKRWFLSVFSDIGRDEMDGVLTALNTPKPDELKPDTQ